MNTIPTIYSNSWKSYALLDSGNGEKLETFAGYTMIRPDPRVIWSRNQSQALWENIDAHFIRIDSEHGNWEIKKQAPSPWIIEYKNMKFSLHPTDFKHVGLFPEQAPNWDWVQEQCKELASPSILNLFGYTGAATVAACLAGAYVTHVDSSKPSLTWAHENCDINNIASTQTRWIIEDASRFVTNEQRRGKLYDGIILDPPRFGRGVKGEIWKLAEDLPNLFQNIKLLLKPHKSFILLNAYTADLSTIALYNLAKSVFKTNPHECEVYELATKELHSDRLLPQGIIIRLSIL